MVYQNESRIRKSVLPYIYTDARVAIFIDGANLRYTMKNLNMRMDYEKMLLKLPGDGRLVGAFWFDAVRESSIREPNQRQKELDYLEYNGYFLVTKPTKEWKDADDNLTIKGNMDVELAVHMMEMIPNMDHAILFSGDGDFRSLVRAVQLKGIRVTVISSEKAGNMANELKRQASEFIELDELTELKLTPRIIEHSSSEES